MDVEYQFNEVCEAIVQLAARRVQRCYGIVDGLDSMKEALVEHIHDGLRLTTLAHCAG